MLHVDKYKILLALSNNYARDKDFLKGALFKAEFPWSRGRIPSSTACVPLHNQLQLVSMEENHPIQE